jgi:hypothetical protein
MAPGEPRKGDEVGRGSYKSCGRSRVQASPTLARREARAEQLQRSRETVRCQLRTDFKLPP